VAGKKERQRKLAAERHRRRLARRAQRDRRATRVTMAITAVIVVAGLSVGGVLLASTSSGTTTTPKSTPTPTATPTPTPTPSPTVAEPATQCVYTAAGTAARKVSLPSATPNYKATYAATINTNRGAIVIDLLNSKATCTVNSFVHLAEAAFYNNSPCFRLSTSGGVYILQCGDPTGKGSGGPGYGFANENLTGATYPAGTLAMANVSGVANSNGSQFFLVYKNSSLPPDYTPFGKIVSGLNILQTVAKGGYGKPLSSGGGGAPKEKVEIESVTIKQT
jgi:peptidyl-prolyl cis-trans isomerase B (cyclophilin B)